MNHKILAFIYNQKKNKFLILKTNGDDPEKHGKSHWFTTTGSVENKESYEEAVRREDETINWRACRAVQGKR